MEKATFLKIFLVSLLLILSGQGSHAVGCTKDADCAKAVRCIDAHPICNLATHQCGCPQAPPAKHGMTDQN
ncbi:hypothetical protein P3L10_010907 [Capsicum annuum]